MGVPAFFRWLTLRCPKILQDAIEPINEEELKALWGLENEENGNPDVDNLYLDMNGIIHPCSHPQAKGVPMPLNDEDRFNNIFNYTDKLFSIVKPRKLLFIAIDGVAPRAKMNQQRGRRFRAAEESKILAEKKKMFAADFARNGDLVDPEELIETSWDHNVITPGTVFMQELSDRLRKYIEQRVQDGIFQNIKVVFSDWSMPGEGEHKILHFIRNQRLQDGYDPNTTHCIYGADADLLFLALSTHEAKMLVIRETVMQRQDIKCNICGKEGHWGDECPVAKGKIEQEQDFGGPKKQIVVNFQYVKLWVLREWMGIEFEQLELGFDFDIERIIDDFVFMSFFVGNDFLPHLPTLNIRAGGIECLLFLYKRVLPFLGGYITENGTINLMRLDAFLKEIGNIEEMMLQFESRDEINRQEREQVRKMQQEQQQGRRNDQMQFNKPWQQQQQQQGMLREMEPVYQQRKQLQQESQEKQGVQNKDAAAKLKELLLKKLQKEDNHNGQGVSVQQIEQPKPNTIQPQEQQINQEDLKTKFTEEFSKLVKKEESEINQIYMSEARQYKIDMGKPGYKQRYYKQKFQIDPKDFYEFQAQIKQHYIEGLCWNYAYYYKGCISWSWYYPYHYSPFASDLCSLGNLQIKFEYGEPFRPIDQLLAVLSPLSSEAVPECLRPLMNDDNSEIIDFYPKKFYSDTKGKKYAWLAEVILPFLDEQRLLNAIGKHSAGMTREELKRNAKGCD